MAKKDKKEAPITVLGEAATIIYGDREQTYGHPAINLESIADLWQAYLRTRAKHCEDEFEMQSEDVCWMMVLLKMARQAHMHKRDNLVDAIGYIALIERLDDGSEEA